MQVLFLKLLNISYSAFWLILAVIGLRFLLRKSPRWMVCLLWALVGFRLLCPINLESPTALVPESQYSVEYFAANMDPDYVPGLTPESDPVAYETSDGFHFVTVASQVWALGAGVMLGYLLLSWMRLKRMVREAAPMSPGVWLCDRVRTPFLLGVIRPQIYLPSDLSPESLPHVLAHEEAHLRRWDHIWKPLGFLLLAVYWFHPLVWVAYILFCRDIELACDEKVIGSLSLSGKKAYSLALLNCSTSRQMVLTCPLAFGEVAVRERIKHVLNYKKPGFWLALLAVIALVFAALCFSTVIPQKEAPVPVPGAGDHVPMRDPDLAPITSLSDPDLVPGGGTSVHPSTGGISWAKRGEDIPASWGWTVETSDPTSTGVTITLHTGPNSSHGPVTANGHYWIEQLYEGSWHRVPMDVAGFGPETFELPAGDTWSTRIDWTDIYGPLGPTTYRICKSMTTGTEELKLYTCYWEFEVTP